MRTHRFYVANKRLDSELTVDDKSLVWQWNKVLRLKLDQQLNLFNHTQNEATYKILKISNKFAHLEKITDVPPEVTGKRLYLFWSLLKRDNNELILQKCTELGVSYFIPLISERTIKKDFNLERAQKIVIEASEQCGRTDVPKIYAPLKLENAVKDYQNKLQLLVADQNSPSSDLKHSGENAVGVLIGPEGGWSAGELAIFKKWKLSTIKISQFTLRAETAAIVAASKLL